MIWRPVIGHEERYEVSNFGDVRRIGGDVLNPWISSQGYKKVRFSDARRGKREQPLVHRLVAFAFIPNPNGFNVVNHIDFNPLNNHVDNLEWCTQGDNVRHSRDHGRIAQYWLGKKSINRKLTDDQLGVVRRLRAGGMSLEKIGVEVGVSKRTILRIVQGEYYVNT